jgi:hypothetical protein
MSRNETSGVTSDTAVCVTVSVPVRVAAGARCGPTCPVGNGTTCVAAVVCVAATVCVSKGDAATCVAVGKGVQVGVGRRVEVGVLVAVPVLVAVLVAVAEVTAARVGTRVESWAGMEEAGACAAASLLARVKKADPMTNANSSRVSVISPGQVPKMARV